MSSRGSWGKARWSRRPTPISGQLNYSNIGGLDLATRPVGIPLTATSMAFIQAVYEGRNVTRIDYSCSVTKL